MAKEILIYTESNPGNNYKKNTWRDTYICTYATYDLVGILNTSPDNTSFSGGR